MENICDYKNCKKIGKHKAPIEKDNSKKFRWLCLDHIKEFNQRWDYFKGMSDHEIYNFLKSDMTWHKPTQSFSSSDSFFKFERKLLISDKNSIAPAQRTLSKTILNLIFSISALTFFTRESFNSPSIFSDISTATRRDGL